MSPGWAAGAPWRAAEAAVAEAAGPVEATRSVPTKACRSRAGAAVEGRRPRKEARPSHLLRGEPPGGRRTPSPALRGAGWRRRPAGGCCWGETPWGAGWGETLHQPGGGGGRCSGHHIGVCRSSWFSLRPLPRPVSGGRTRGWGGAADTSWGVLQLIRGCSSSKGVTRPPSSSSSLTSAPLKVRGGGGWTDQWGDCS